MKNLVVNLVVVVVAGLYLIAKSLTNSLREVRDDVQLIIGEVSLIRSILFLCVGIVATGSLAVFIALIK